MGTLALIASLVLSMGCSGNPSASAPHATAVLVDMEGVKHHVPQGEADYVAGLVAATPDTDTRTHLALDPPYRVIVNGVDLALQPDRLILMHEDGTRTWNAAGVRKRILTAVGK